MGRNQPRHWQFSESRLLASGEVFAVRCECALQIHNRQGGRHPREGRLDRLLGMFEQAGYQGYISLEYEDEEAAGTAVPRLAVELRRKIQKYWA